MGKKYVIDESTLTDMANAIRSKTSSTASMTAEEMDNAILSIETGVDTSDATAAAEEILAGETAYANGEKITGTMPNNGELSATFDGVNTKQYTVPAGYTSGGTVSLDNTIDNEVTEQADLISQIKSAVNELPEVGSGNVETVEQATPSITVSSNGLITASATQTEGYVEAGTKSATKQLTTQVAKTITPSTSSQTAVASGRYTTGTVTVSAIPSSYVKPTATKAATTYTPTTTSQTISSGTYCSGTQTILGDTNLVAGNIKSGVSIFGVNGSYEGSGSGGPSGGTQTANISFTIDAPIDGQEQLIYISANGIQTVNLLNYELAGPASIQCIAPSIISIYSEGRWVFMSFTTSGNVSKINNNVYYVTGDGSLYYG